ncbi:MAG: PilW family protein [Rhodocyclaceae bacterium]|nr:PilW family protein [Rhodocyclaceae bacterium]
MPIRQQRGFTLIELMIGLTISLLGLAAVSGMMMTFSKKRTSIVSTMTAQDNGVMALYRIEKDIAQAGYGLMSLQACSSLSVASGSPLSPLPVQITSGSGGASDAIDVQYVNTTSGVPGTELLATGAQNYTMTTSQYNVRSSLGFAVGDRVVSTAAVPSCAITTITSVTDPAVSPGAIGHDATLTASATPGFLANLGPVGSVVSRRFVISSNSLQVAEDAPAYASPNLLVDDIVYMKAQYGLADTSSGRTVTSWVDSSAFTIGTANVGRVIALRVGVVARTAASDSETVDQPATLTVLPDVANSGGTTIGSAVSYTIPDTRYRYRAYTTTIPLRNAIWTRT